MTKGEEGKADQAPQAVRTSKVLKSVKCDDAAMKELVAMIHSKCVTCKKFLSTPPRPVVSLPAASDFNEVMTKDLKEVKVGNFKYVGDKI